MAAAAMVPVVLLSFSCVAKMHCAKALGPTARASEREPQGLRLKIFLSCYFAEESYKIQDPIMADLEVMYGYRTLGFRLNPKPSMCLTHKALGLACQAMIADFAEELEAHVSFCIIQVLQLTRCKGQPKQNPV